MVKWTFQNMKSSYGFTQEPTILVQAYFVIQACSFFGLFRHKFAENGPQYLKMV